MNIENRLKLFRTEKTKILGFGRSHLRSVELARKLENDVEKKVRKAKKDFTTKQAFLFFLWDAVKDRGDELLRREHFQFRVFDEGTVEFLDQNFIQRPGNGIETKFEDVQELIAPLPEKVRAILQLHYQGGLNCKAIAKKIGTPVEEVYQLWQHSLIYLWEALQSGDNEGFREQDDEAFWTLALKYLDGTASEKFVAELNSEIHVNKTRTKEYNDLRMIDGVMIGFGSTDLWPECALVGSSSGENQKTNHTASEIQPKKQRSGRGFAFPALATGLIGSLIGVTRRIAGKSGPQKPEKAKSENDLPEGENGDRPLAPAENTSEIKPAPAKKPRPKAILANESLDKSTRHGVSIDPKRRHLRIRIPAQLLRQIGILGLVGVGVWLLSLLGDRFESDTGGGSPRVLKSSDVEFSDGTKWNGRSLKRGTFIMAKGTMELHTSDSIGIIIEAPARFTLKSDHEIDLKQGRIVANVPSLAPRGMKITTDRFQFSTTEGEIGVIADEKSIDLLVFNGEGTIDSTGQKIGPGDGLRFFEIGQPEAIVARDEAYRFPESIPSVSPKAYGDNLVVNHSFEIGLLSRSCKTERLYRDIPTGWKAGWQVNGVWTEGLEQHSGTVRITDAIGGLPTPVDGERYLWINHGFVAREVTALEPGAKYELSLQIASHRHLGPGADHLVRNIGGNTFRFGIWSGSEWIAETSGQLEAGQPFQEMKMEFQFPETGLPGMVPVLMLTGETRIFYDKVELRKK